MKSEHRHDLETNELARRLATVIRRVQPYFSSMVTVALVVLALILAAGYLQKSTAARQGEAWDVYNEAIEGRTPDLDLLKQSAELYAGSTMSQLSEITWADGQLWQAARRFISFRDAAIDSLSKAESAYLNLADSADDPHIRDRAHFGLARVYEMSNEFEKAREQYLAVAGGFAELARERAEALSQQRVIQASRWLATTKPTPRLSPTGPGIPGEKPEFDADELGVFAEETDEGVGLGEMLESFGRSGDEGEDRYSLELPDVNNVLEGENEQAGNDQEVQEPAADDLDTDENDAGEIDANDTDGDTLNEEEAAPTEDEQTEAKAPDVPAADEADSASGESPTP